MGGEADARGQQLRSTPTLLRHHVQLPWRTLAVLLIPYAALTVAVVVGSPLDGLDRAAAHLRLSHHWPDLTPWVSHYVVIAQRAPSALVAGGFVLWWSWRRRSAYPFVMFLTALVLLNLTVGAVKVGTGRLGPLLTTHPRAVFDGGDIFPSGHTSNAVVIFGVLAMLASRRKRLATVLATFGAATVGLSTIFLDTHWATDVIGGWLAGGLVLIGLPWATAQARTAFARVVRLRRDGRRRAQPVMDCSQPAGSGNPAATGARPRILQSTKSEAARSPLLDSRHAAATAQRHSRGTSTTRSATGDRRQHRDRVLG